MDKTDELCTCGHSIFAHTNEVGCTAKAVGEDRCDCGTTKDSLILALIRERDEARRIALLYRHYGGGDAENAKVGDHKVHEILHTWFSGGWFDRYMREDGAR